MLIVNERISIVVCLTLIGLAFYSALDFSMQTTDITVLDELFRGHNSAKGWLVIVILTGLAITGTDTIIRAHPALSNRRLAYVITFCTLPGLLVAVVTQLLRLAPTTIIWAIGLIVVGVLLWLIIISQFQQVLEEPRLARGWHRLIQQLIGYGLAALAYMVVYRSGNNSLTIMLTAGAITLMVTLPLLRHSPDVIGKTWLYGGVITLGIAQVALILTYWPIRAIHAGLFLFLLLYVMVGIAQQQLLNQFSQRLVIEFGVIAIIALFIIFRL